LSLRISQPILTPVTDSREDRYEPLPGLLQLPGFLLRKLSRRTRIALLVGVVACAALAVILVAPAVQDAKQAADRRERLEHRVAVRRERRRLIRDQRPHRARATSRAAATRELERAITNDARERFRRHLLPGPRVQTTRCDQSSAERTASRRYFTCIALTSPSLGFEFVAVVDDRRRRLTWCKTNPPGATDAAPLATVALSPACLGR
jgi:hypothetical protein